MNKMFLGLIFFVLVLSCSTVFATQDNSINSFNAHWDNGSNQIVYNLSCKYQAIAVMQVSYNGSTRSTICSTIALGQTWAGLGGFVTSNIPQMDVTVTIPAPCDVCSKTIHLNPMGTDENNGGEFSIIWIFVGILVIVCIGVIIVLDFLKKRQ